MDIRKIEKAARQQGWETGITRKGHRTFRSPITGETLVYSGTPSDVRSIRNHLSRMERNGFVWPWDKRAQREWKKRNR